MIFVAEEEKIKVTLLVEESNGDVYQICSVEVPFGQVKKIKSCGKKLLEEKQIKIYPHVEVEITLTGEVRLNATTGGKM